MTDILRLSLNKKRQKLGSNLWIYIAKEFLFSLIVAFLFFFFLFFINQLLVIARDVLSKRVDILRTLLLIVYAMPAIIALSVPFASLVGCIMAVGRLSSDNEIVALQACGINLIQVFIPILILAIILGLFSFIVNDILLPIGTVNYLKLYQELLFTNSELILEPYSVTKFNTTTLISTSVIKGVLGPIILIDTDEEGRKRIINASSGKLLQNTNQIGIISLELDGVGVINISKSTTDYDVNESKNIVYNMLLKTLSDSLHNPGPKEMSSIDLSYKIEELKKKNLKKISQKNFLYYKKVINSRFDYMIFSHERYGVKKEFIESILFLKNKNLDLNNKSSEKISDRNLQSYLIEFWKKFSFPSASFILIFLGFPAGIFAKRSGRSIGFGIGFVIAVIFWAMIMAGQIIGVDNPSINPFLLMWAPNILFFIIGIFMFIKRIIR